MSVNLYKYSGDIDDGDSKLLGSLAISAEKFYYIYWVEAIEACDVKLFKVYSHFDYSDKETVMSELERLREWCENKNMIEDDGRYMYARIDHLIEELPALFEMGEGIFYIL